MPLGTRGHKRLQVELSEVIDELDLPETNRHYLRSRWLDQVLFHHARAEASQKLYTSLRLLVIFGGIAVPALSSLTNPALTNIGNPSTVASPTILSGSGALTVGWITFVLGLVVAFSAAVEQFLNSGQQVRYHRNLAERLQNEFWTYFALTSHYRAFQSHNAAFPRYTQRTEHLLSQTSTRSSDEGQLEEVREDVDEDEGKSSADRRRHSH
jgi:ABC-type multidrug transport system fused ATPase/permease subunit